MKKSVYVYDSYALMCFFLKQPGALKVKEILHSAEANDCTIKLSIINWGEIYYSIFRTKGKNFAEETLSLIDAYPIELVGVDRKLVYEAAQIKSSYSISYADSFVAALSIREHGIVVTGDPEFHKIADQLSIEWLK